MEACFSDCLNLLEKEYCRDGPGLTQFWCVGHMLQFAIEDTIRKLSKSGVIENARRVCIKLRTPNVMSLLKSSAATKPDS